MTQTAHAPPRFARFSRFLRSPLFPIFMIVFVDMLGLGITIPVVPLYAEGVFGATASQITLLASVYFTAQFIALPRLGRLSDRVGRRPVLIISQVGTFAALLLSGAAPAMLLLYVARTIDGLTGGNISVAQAYISDITDESNRARGMGIISAAFGSGFIFGPAFGGLMAARFGPRMPFFVAAGVSLLTISLSYFALPESLTSRPGRRDEADEAARPLSATSRRGKSVRATLLRLRGVALIMAIAFGGQFAFFGFQSTWVLWAEALLFAGRDPKFVQQAVGGVFTLVGLFAIATQVWLVGPLARRFGEKAMVAGGVFARGSAFTVMAALPRVAPTLVAMPLIAVGSGVSQPALIALLTYTAPPDQRGHVIGLMQSVQSLGRILGPLLAGVLFQHVSPGAPIWTAALLSALTLAAAMGLWRAGPAKAGRPAPATIPAGEGVLMTGPVLADDER